MLPHDGGQQEVLLTDADLRSHSGAIMKIICDCGVELLSTSHHYDGWDLDIESTPTGLHIGFGCVPDIPGSSEPISVDNIFHGEPDPNKPAFAIECGCGRKLLRVDRDSSLRAVA